MENELLSHVIEIKERLASIEANTENMQDALRSNMQAQQVTNAEVDDVKQDLTEVKTSLKIFKWGIPVLVAAAVGVVKAFKN